MHKMVKTTLALTTAFLLLTGCSMQSSWTLTINETGAYTAVSAPYGNGVSFGWEESEEHSSGTITLKKDGEYEVVVKDKDGNQYTITIIRKDGKVEAKSDDGISVDLKKK